MREVDLLQLERSIEGSSRVLLGRRVPFQDQRKELLSRSVHMLVRDGDHKDTRLVRMSILHVLVPRLSGQPPCLVLPV